MARVLFYVQHLLGIGHLTRASLIAKALRDAGMEVTIVSGGMPVAGFPGPGIGLVQLPPVHSPADFSGLMDEHGNRLNEAFRAMRRGRLLAAFADARPDALIVEAYPFARRHLRFELGPLLAAARAARPRPLVVSSVRDIVQRIGKPESVDFIIDTVKSSFDLVLVHGDERFARLSDSFPEAREFEDRIVHTGLVAGPAATSADRFAVVVSAGGGAVGGALAFAAVEARPLTRYADEPWLVVTGPNARDDTVAGLRRMAPKGVTIERFRSDFPGLIADASLSISQAGYNTVCDILRGGCRAVLVPFAAGGETEQSERAEKLEKLGRVAVAAEAGLDAATLAAAIERAPDPRDVPVDLQGAENSARIIGKRLKIM